MPYPAYVPSGLLLIYPLARLKLPVLAASKIAETFPEGRGSPHGCGLRAVFLHGRCLGPTRSLQG
ncbi:Uncharacterised protein [Klebsiella pneumoniae]|uniref:Uncharacterized protein n=1 Tax=Klebsiella pneumoniae TaxID=573 RepID=A0A3S4GG31_KLEPN|nr:Uncharacterised protein [Klebsiella pneumoniae]